MTTLTRYFVLLWIVAQGQTALADVYRCKLPDGKTVYQEKPCSGGEQKALDDRQERARLTKEQERKKEEVQKARARVDRELNKKQNEERVAQNKARLKACLKGIDNCELSDYQDYIARGHYRLSPYDVEEVLGVPSHIQEFGLKRYWYYWVPISHNGIKRRGKLQLVISGNFIDNVNGSY